MTLALLRKPEITEQDLVGLINTVSERQNIDFKKDAYDSRKPNWQKDLCADVTAFANADGGIIVCGMTEKNGYADELCGLGEIDTDIERRRLKQTISSNISPVISGIQILDIKLSDPEKGFAIVIKIPRSVYQPHRSQVTKLFSIRRSNGNEDMSVDELRNAFNLSATFIERAKGFRKERIKAIVNRQKGKIPYELHEGLKVVLHIIPFSSLGVGQKIDISQFGDHQRTPLWAKQLGLYQGKFNQYGFAHASNFRNEPISTYTQINRTGIIENVWYFNRDLSHPLIGLHYIEEKTLDFIKDIFTILHNLELNPPFIVMLSLLDVTGYIIHPHYIVTNDRIDLLIMDNHAYESNYNEILLDDIVIEGYTDNYGKALRPLFDELYNTAGHSKSRNYDEDGNWKEPQKRR